MEGFVRIHPQIEFEAFCPFVGTTLPAIDWAVPGMWTLARLQCADSGRTYWTDLPSGLGLLAPCVIDEGSGEVVRPAGGRWYADVTRAAWRTQSDKPTRVRVERRRHVRRACLINCLNPCWGDAVSLLLRINQLRDRSDLDIIVLATANLAWLIPDFVAEAWLVEDSLSSTSRWNNDVARQVKALVSALDECYIPITFQPAQLSPEELFDFSRVQPFPREDWNARLKARPVVTFVWRSDRCWSRDAAAPGGMLSKLTRVPYVRGASNYFHRARAAYALRDQTRRVVALARRLRRQIPGIDVAVMGLGEGAAFPSWITDLRRNTIDQTTEREWCARAADSHVIVGVHGSHMLLPSGHAGAVIELLPRDRIGNALQDLLVPIDPREALYCCRLVPLDTSAGVIAEMVISVLDNYSWNHFAYHRRYTGPLSPDDVHAIRDSQAARAELLLSTPTGSPARLLGP